MSIFFSTSELLKFVCNKKNMDNNHLANYTKEERKAHILKEINLHTRVSFDTLSNQLFCF